MAFASHSSIFRFIRKPLLRSSLFRRRTSTTMAAAAAAPAPYRSYIEPNADAEFPAEKDRYHLYVTYGCPFACRALSARNLLGLQDVISVSYAHSINQRTRPDDENDTHRGWTFYDAATTPTVLALNGKEYPTGSTTIDHVNHQKYVRDIYELVDKTPRRYTVPLLWDKKKQTIVSNESEDILRTFNSGFRELVSSNVDLYPKGHEAEIDALNNGIVAEVTTSFFKMAFSKDPAEAPALADAFFAAVKKLDGMLATSRFLHSSGVTEADVRMFHTLIRADVSGYTDPMKRLATYSNVVGYLRDLYQLGLKSTVDFEQLKVAFVNLRPEAADVEGPFIDYDGPQDRANL